MKTCQALILVLTVSTCTQATILSNQEFTVDFTDPNAVFTNVLDWTPQDKVQQTDMGLIFQNPSPNASVDFSLTTKPYALGLSWRPTYTADLGVELSPLGEEISYSEMTLQPSSYAVFVRYSADLKSWSSWQVLQEKRLNWEEKKKAGSHQFSIQLRVPDKERAEYVDHLYQYMRMDVPWPSDEEAMVEWILIKAPDFFEKHIPFIGYVQFLCESSSFRANQPLAQMKINIHWGVGGLHATPKDESVYRNRDNIPWRYKAPDAILSPINHTIW